MSPIVPFEPKRSQPAASSAETDPVKVLLLTLGSREYAVDVTAVAEVVMVPAIMKVAGTDPFLLGVVNVRGNFVPVVDVAPRLGEKPLLIPPPSPTSPGRLVIYKPGPCYIGFLADKVENRLGEGIVEEEATYARRKPLREVILGERKIPLLDLDTLMTSAEIATLEKVKSGFLALPA
jgi:chemotaxis signal transduction protein